MVDIHIAATTSGSVGIYNLTEINVLAELPRV